MAMIVDSQLFQGPNMGVSSGRHVLRRRLERSILGLGLIALELLPMARRTADVVASGLGLIVLSPLLLALAVLIKLGSKGPVFFRQTRVGQGGRPFQMLKLRTMFCGADAQKSQLQAREVGAVSGVRFKLRHDPRVTPLGRILRRLSLDELPQLLNVTLGDMTLIGPRPAVLREVALYDARALRRLEVPQGLTCLWQVGGRSDLSFDEQISLDVEYIDRSSFTDDLSILARTVPAVLSGRGAY